MLLLLHTGQSMLCRNPVFASELAVLPCQLPCSLAHYTATCTALQSTHRTQPCCIGGHHSVLPVVSPLTESILWTCLALYAECAVYPTAL